MDGNIKECGMCFECKPAAISYEFSGGYQDIGYLCYDCAEEVLMLFNTADVPVVSGDEEE